MIASRTCCLGEAELATLRDYVKGGGTLLVDESFAMFDDHGNARQAERIPLLDTSRPLLRATFGQIDVANTADCEPVVTQIGKGRVILLNASLVSYGQTPRDAVRRTLRRSIAGYLPSPPVRLLADGQPVFDVDVYRYPLKDGEGYGLCATRPDTQVAATLVSEGSREWVDVASGARLGTGRINVTIPANRALFIQAVRSPSSRPGPG